MFLLYVFIAIIKYNLTFITGYKLERKVITVKPGQVIMFFAHIIHGGIRDPVNLALSPYNNEEFDPCSGKMFLPFSLQGAEIDLKPSDTISKTRKCKTKVMKPSDTSKTPTCFTQVMYDTLVAKGHIDEEHLKFEMFSR